MINKDLLKTAIRNELKSSLKEIVYLVWLSDADIDVSDDCKTIRIISPSEFKARTVESALYSEVERAIVSVVGFAPKIDYLFSTEDGVTLSVLNDKERQSYLDEMKILLDAIVDYIINTSSDSTILYIAPDIKKGVLSVKNNIATFDFNYIHLLRVVEKHCSDILVEALNEMLDRDDVQLKFLYCGSEYEEF